MGENLNRREFVRLAGGATALTAALGVEGFIAACGGSGGNAPAKPVEKDVSKLYDAAKKEGKVVWWTAHYEQSAAETMAAAFKQKYPGVDVELLRQTAQVLNTRLQADLKAGTVSCDVFCSTDEAHYPPLKKANELTSWTPPDIDLIPKFLQNIDPDNTYHVGAIGFDVINYRTDKVSTPPKAWKDLIDPQWKGKLTFGHPGASGYVGNWVVAMIDKYGESYIRDLAKNDPKKNRSVNDTVTDIVNGERQVGSGPDNFSLANKAKGNPIDIVWPSDDAILIAGPVGIMAKGSHPNAAQLFANFMYSKEYSTALVSTYNYPLRADVTLPAGVPALEKIKWYRNKIDRLTTGVPQAIDLWRQYMGV